MASFPVCTRIESDAFTNCEKLAAIYLLSMNIVATTSSMANIFANCSLL